MTNTVEDTFKMISLPLDDEHKNRLLLFAMVPNLEICATTIAELMPYLPEGTKPTEIAACLRTLRGEVIE